MPAPAAPLPPMPPAAGVNESRSSSYPVTRSYYLAPAIAVISNTVPVAFWNRSSRDTWVWISGEWRWLQQGRGLTLDLPRELTGGSRPPQSRQERVAGNQSTWEIDIP